MCENTTNLFELSFDAINPIKKKDPAGKIEKLKGKVIVDNGIKNLYDQVSRLSENLAKLMESNEKLSSQFIVVEKVDALLEKLVSQAKAKQYSSRNNAEISGIPHEILDPILEVKVIDICKIGHMDIERCHRLLLRRNNTGDTKRIRVKFVNRKHSEDILRLKKIISYRSKALVSNLLCPYYCYLWTKC